MNASTKETNAPKAPPRKRLRLKVDAIRCAGFGFCAEHSPELFRLDDWEYAWLTRAEVPPQLEALARETARLCPVAAIHIEEIESH
jgi:ferredoxin